MILQTASGFEIQLHVVREVYADSGNSTLMKLWSILEQNASIIGKILEHCLKTL